jgi:hypothetical protein
MSIYGHCRTSILVGGPHGGSFSMHVTYHPCAACHEVGLVNEDGMHHVWKLSGEVMPPLTAPVVYAYGGTVTIGDIIA